MFPIISMENDLQGSLEVEDNESSFVEPTFFPLSLNNPLFFLENAPFVAKENIPSMNSQTARTSTEVVNNLSVDKIYHDPHFIIPLFYKLGWKWSTRELQLAKHIATRLEDMLVHGVDLLRLHNQNFDINFHMLTELLTKEEMWTHGSSLGSKFKLLEIMVTIYQMNVILLVTSNIHYKKTPSFSLIEDMIRVDGHDCTLDTPNYTLTLRETSYHLTLNGSKESRLYFSGGRNTFLMILDVLKQRKNTILYCGLSSLLQVQIVPCVSLLTQTHHIFDTVLLNHGNNAFKLIKMYEPIVLGVMQITSSSLSGNPGFVDSTEFLNFVLKEAHLLDLIEQKSLLSWIEELRKLTLPQLSEMFSMYRQWGHPFVNTSSGIEKVKLIAQKKTLPTSYILQPYVAFMVYKICKQHRRKNKLWPDICRSSLSPILQSWITSNAQPYWKRNMISDWCNVKFKKNSGDIGEQAMLSTLSDKAISLPYDQLIESIKSRKTIGSSQERRALIDFVTSEDVLPEKFLKNIDKYGIPQEYKVIGVHSKERELNPDPRLFPINTAYTRSYFVLTEYLLSKFLIPLFPDIAMTLSQCKLWNKLTHNSSNLLKSKFPTVFVSIDFKKWNLHWRYSTTEPFFRHLDNYLGYSNLITRTHEIFEGSVIYSTDGIKDISITPDYKLKGEHVWEGHLGGFEGLRQKGWTIITSTIISYIANSYPLNVQIIGQGDNQVLTIDVKKSRLEEFTSGSKEYAEIVKLFLKDLEVQFSLLNLPIKPIETWKSHTLFTYGKQFYHNGAILPQGIKSVSRMSFTTNVAFPSLFNFLSNIESTAISSSTTASIPLVPFLMYWIELPDLCYAYSTTSPLLGPLTNVYPTATKISGKSLYNKIKNTNLSSYTAVINNMSPTTLLRALLSFSLLPRSLGGIPVPLVADFLSRGFPDPITKALSTLKVCTSSLHMNEIKTTNPYLHLCVKLSRYIYIELAESKKTLLLEPTAINTLSHPLVFEVLGEIVQTGLNNFPMLKNTSVIKALRAFSLDEMTLISDLEKSIPFHGRIVSDIYNASLVAKAIQLKKRFEKTSTMIKLLKHSSSANELRHRIEQTEKKTISHILFLHHLKICSQEASHKVDSISLTQKLGWIDVFNISECATVIARRLRDLSWGQTIEGVTVPHHFCLFDNISPLTFLPSTKHLGNYLSVHLSNDFVKKCLKDIAIKKGPFKPYYGSTTKQKVRHLDSLSTVSLESSLKKLSNILLLGGWAYKLDSNIQVLLERLFREITNLDPSLFIPSTNLCSGSLTHRYTNPLINHEGAISFLPSFGSHMGISNNNMYDFQRGSANRTIMFQHHMTMVQSLLLMSKILSKEPLVCTTYVSRVTCDECVILVNDQPMDLIAPPNYSPSIDFHDTIFFTTWENLPVKSVSRLRTAPVILDIHDMSTTSLSHLISSSLGLFSNKINGSNKLLHKPLGISVTRFYIKTNTLHTFVVRSILNELIFNPQLFIQSVCSLNLSKLSTQRALLLTLSNLIPTEIWLGLFNDNTNIINLVKYYKLVPIQRCYWTTKNSGKKIIKSLIWQILLHEVIPNLHSLLRESIKYLHYTEATASNILWMGTLLFFLEHPSYAPHIDRMCHLGREYLSMSHSSDFALRDILKLPYIRRYMHYVFIHDNSADTDISKYLETQVPTIVWSIPMSTNKKIPHTILSFCEQISSGSVHMLIYEMAKNLFVHVSAPFKFSIAIDLVSKLLDNSVSAPLVIGLCDGLGYLSNYVASVLNGDVITTNLHTYKHIIPGVADQGLYPSRWFYQPKNTPCEHTERMIVDIFNTRLLNNLLNVTWRKAILNTNTIIMTIDPETPDKNFSLEDYKLMIALCSDALKIYLHVSSLYLIIKTYLDIKSYLHGLSMVEWVYTYCLVNEKSRCSEFINTVKFTRQATRPRTYNIPPIPPSNHSYIDTFKFILDHVRNLGIMNEVSNKQFIDFFLMDAGVPMKIVLNPYNNEKLSLIRDLLYEYPELEKLFNIVSLIHLPLLQSITNNTTQNELLTLTAKYVEEIRDKRRNNKSGYLNLYKLICYLLLF